MSDSTTIDEKHYKHHSFDLASTVSRYDSECASIWTESTVDSPHPTRSYQVALLFAGFMATFQTIGTNQTYGIFQASPPEFYTSPGSNIVDGPGQYAMAALVGTIGGGLTWSGSIFVSLIISSGCDLRLMCLAGAALMSMGLILASFATKLWQLFITQAILFGIGSSMLYYPMTSLTPRFFDRHRGFAMGIALSGSGAGGLVLAPVTQSLLARFGAPVTLRILGVWNFVVCIPISFVVRRPPGYTPARLSLTLAKKGTFLLQLLASFLQAAGNIIPLYYLTMYSASVLGLSTSTASILLAVNNAVNSVARVLMGLTADYVGRQNTMVGCVLFSSLTVLAFWLNADRGRFLTFVVLYGVGSGGYSALLPTIIAEVFGKEQYSSANAAIYFIRGFGAVFGAPVAGAILGNHDPSEQSELSVAELKTRFNRVAGYDGVLLFVAGVCVVLVRWLDAKAKGKWKWLA
ncbi:MFS general substrate transporter [Multifurca ochricompacta]|uniref:MFS general substrate transporter n=1 Tax=Multifurca ochricompacta TaxID=376703 RepID=A0AAD4QSC6_9AGAM|nr:MFS general substrate transporter [Multifurca ochricompacta]